MESVKSESIRSEKNVKGNNSEGNVMRFRDIQLLDN